MVTDSDVTTWSGRTQESKNREIISVKDFGAIGDGALHPLSEKFSTLVAAQAVYPFITSLDQSIDWAAIQKAVNTSDSIYILDGTYVVSNQILRSRGNFSFKMSNNSLIDATNISNSNIDNETPALFRVSGGDFFKKTKIISNIFIGDKKIYVENAVGIEPGDTLYIYSGIIYPSSIFNENSQLWYYVNDLKVPRLMHAIVSKVENNSIYLSLPSEFDFSILNEITCEIRRPIKNIDLIVNAIDRKTPNTGLLNGQGLSCIKIVNCINYSLGGNIKYFQGHSIRVDHSFFGRANTSLYMEGLPDGYIYDVNIFENQGSGYYGIFINRSYCFNANNVISHKVRHLIDGAYSKAISADNCFSTMSHRAPFRTHPGCWETRYCNNKCDGGAGGIADAGWSGNFCNNILYTSTHDPVISLTNASISLLPEDSKNSLGGYTIVCNNNLICHALDTFAIVAGGFYDQLLITNNSFKTSLGIRILSIKIDQACINSNIGHLFSTSLSADGIGFYYSDKIVQRENISVLNNNIKGYIRNGVRFEGGTKNNRANNIVIGDGIYIGIGACISLPTGYYGEFLKINSNMVGSNPVQSYSFGDKWRFESSPIIEPTINGSHISSGAPYIIGTGTNVSDVGTPLTVRRGATIVNSFVTNPSGLPEKLIATDNGTTGNLIGVTANTAAGSSIITLDGNSESKVYKGCWLVINNNNIARVVNVSDDYATITIASIYPSTGVNLSVQYRDPNFKEASQISI